MSRAMEVDVSIFLRERSSNKQHRGVLKLDNALVSNSMLFFFFLDKANGYNIKSVYI